MFYEEELDVPLVLFDEVLEHVLRIDRIFRQPQGHLLLIGVSGAGKTTLSRFVAWMNGLSIFQIKVCIVIQKFFYIDNQNFQRIGVFRKKKLYHFIFLYKSPNIYQNRFSSHNPVYMNLYNYRLNHVNNTSPYLLMISVTAK